MIVYIVHQLAKEINGDFVSTQIEYASKSEREAFEYIRKQQASNSIIKIEEHMCAIVRQLVPVEVAD